MLYYTGVTVLRMSEKKFWRSTPVILNVLSAVHAEVNSSSSVRKVEFVDEAGIEI